MTFTFDSNRQIYACFTIEKNRCSTVMRCDGLSIRSKIGVTELSIEDALLFFHIIKQDHPSIEMSLNGVGQGLLCPKYKSRSMYGFFTNQEKTLIPEHADYLNRLRNEKKRLIADFLDDKHFELKPTNHASAVTIVIEGNNYQVLKKFLLALKQGNKVIDALLTDDIIMNAESIEPRHVEDANNRDLAPAMC